MNLQDRFRPLECRAGLSACPFSNRASAFHCTDHDSFHEILLHKRIYDQDRYGNHHGRSHTDGIAGYRILLGCLLKDFRNGFVVPQVIVVQNLNQNMLKVSGTMSMVYQLFGQLNKTNSN